MDAVHKIKKPTAHLWPALWHRARLGCLVWLIFCQFPLPIVHSHDGSVALDPLELSSHLQRHHSNSAHFAQIDEHELHWHWLLPSELTWRPIDGENDRPPLAGGLMGFWSGVVPAQTQSSHAHDGGPQTAPVSGDAVVGHISRDLMFDELFQLLSAPLPAHDCLLVDRRLTLRNYVSGADERTMLTRSFPQSFRGVSLANLVCVRLR